MRLQQQMKLAPRLIQAMEILQLPMMALQERIEAELQSNPVLELRNSDVDEQAPPVRDEYAEDRGEAPMVVQDNSDNSEDFKRLAEFEDEFGPELVRSDPPIRPAKIAPGERDRKMDAMANAPAQGQSLNEYLLDQWTFVDMEQDVRDAGRLIINNIDDDGYLRTTLEELSAETNPPGDLQTLRDALDAVQLLEPNGIGARDLQECLLLQLAAEDRAGRDVSLERELVENFLRDIEMNRLPRIARRTGRSIDEIKTALDNLSHLNASPGSLVVQRIVPVIQPDVIVNIDDDGEVVISMHEWNTPQLYISRSYRRMARQRDTAKQARQFIKKNIRSAQWLMDAISQRRETVRRVVGEVFKVQRDFLDDGAEALRPLPMADVAGKVGVHVATVSRAVAGKYVQTPRGIYPLRMFFSGGTKTAEGEDVAWDAIRVRLKEIIEAEDKSAPLNDDHLSAALSKDGINIARRTVAKYRKLLSIPPARKRRQY